MHITSAEFKNLKGRSARYELTPATLIVGGNFSGKTAIADAVRLTLLGYHPDLAKKNSAILDLASGAKMETELLLSTGVSLRREFHFEGGSAKTTSNIDPVRFDTPLLDSTAYFEQTENGRVDYVFSKVTLPEEFTPDGVIATLERISFGEEHTEEIQRAKADFIAICQETFEAEDTVPGALALLSNKTGPLATEYSKFNARVKDSAGTVRILTELKLRESECSAQTLTDIANEISRLEGLLDEANTEAGRLGEQQRQALATSQRRDEIARLLSAPAPQFQPLALELWEDPRPALEQQLAELDAKLAALPARPEGTERALTDARAEYLRLEDAEEDAKEALKQINEQIDQVNALECCPHCKGKAKGWRKHLIASLKDQVPALEAKIKQPAFNAAHTKLEIAQSAHANFQLAQSAFQSATADRWAVVDKITNATQIATRRQQDQGSHESGMRATQAAYDERAQSLREEQERLRVVDAPPQSELDEAQFRLNALRNTLSAENQKRDAAKRLQQDLIRATQAAKEHELAAASLAVCKKFGEEIKAMKRRMVDAAFGSLLTVANSICGDILPSPLAYQGGELGRLTAQGKFIKHQAFSGTEKALAYIGLAAGLSASAPFKLAIIDELGRITPDLQARVCEKLACAVEVGTLDQVIGILPLCAEDAEAFEAPPYWSVIRTGEAVAA